MHIVLIGDSIFDNASYVEEGCSVYDLLSAAFPTDTVTLLAVDGDVTTDVHTQLFSLPKDATHVFVSCGGNDALRSAPILQDSVASVSEALEKLHAVTEQFRKNYSAMLDQIIDRFPAPTFCTIHRHVPELPEDSATALSLFNEIILEEVVKRYCSIIDLRILCNEASDYSPISPIEPSVYGGKKIVNAIKSVICGNGSPEKTTSITH